jgi:hypothetical protein
MTNMAAERNEEIRELAYRIWQEEGYPHGCEVEHWLKAETIWLEEHREKSIPIQPKPESLRKPRSRKTTAVQREL